MNTVICHNPDGDSVTPMPARPRVSGSQMGNAVVVNVVEAIARQVFDAVGQFMPRKYDQEFIKGEMR